MRRTIAILLAAVCVTSATGCSLVATGIDFATGLPVSAVFTEVEETVDEFDEARHEERVRKLREAYRDFSATPAATRFADEIRTDETEPEPVVIVKGDVVY